MTSRIVELTNQLSANVEKVDNHLRSKNLLEPSFDIDGPLELGIQSPDVEAARIAAIEASMELQDLLLGPTMLLRPNYNATSLQAIYKFDIAAKVPMHGEMSFVDLARLCSMYEPDLRRILRFAMCYHHTFVEHRKGYVSHTAVSRAIVEKKGVKDALGVMFDECWQSYARTVEAIERYKSQELSEAGFSLAQNTSLPFYQYLSSYPEKSKRFAGAMQAFGEGPDITPASLVDNFAWDSLGASTVVDVGGSNGSVSMAIAQAYPRLQFIVQDRPEVIQVAERTEMSSDLTGRIKFMAHDFFTKQPVAADLYLFRYIFHNWPDAYAVKILRQIVPALRPGARIVVHDHLLPEPNTASLTEEREARSMDMLMLTLCNARERDRDDWEALFREADERFRLISVCVPRGSSLAIIEVNWEKETSTTLDWDLDRVSKLST